MVPRRTRHALAFALALLAALSVARRGPHDFSPLPEAPAATAPAPILDPNTASRAELESLPGVGPTLAVRIVEARARAPFARVSDLRRVRGIGERTLARIAGRLRVGPESPVRDRAGRSRPPTP